MTYQTQPGTIPHRVVEHLKTLPPGTELSTTELAEAIGANHSGMSACLITAVSHGLLNSDTRPVPMTGRRISYWSLGDGVPVEQPQAEEQEPDLQQKVVRTPAVDVPVVAKPEPAAQPAKIKTSLQRAKPAAPRPAPVQLELPVFAAFSDGRLQIEHEGETITLGSQAANQLHQFMSKVWAPIQE